AHAMSCRYRPSFSCLTEATWQLACRSPRYCPGARAGPPRRPGRVRPTPESILDTGTYMLEGRGGEISMTANITDIDETSLIRPVERPVPLRQSVYEALVELVGEGRLRPGQHLVETELARQLGVSRQPVREALHRL